MALHKYCIIIIIHVILLICTVRVFVVRLKVWYHSNCSNRGKGCYNTCLTSEGGCCIWYNEPTVGYCFHCTLPFCIALQPWSNYRELSVGPNSEGLKVVCISILSGTYTVFENNCIR